MARSVRKALVGKRFGSLEVVNYEGTDKFRNSIWLCKCDCGKYIYEKGTLLTTGKVISCGKCGVKFSLSPIQDEEYTKMRKDYINERFGRLVVVDEFMEQRENSKRAVHYCKCKCDCGNEKVVMLSNLKNGRTLSCGCLQVEKSIGTKHNLTEDLIGKRFNKLLVLGFDDEQKKWKCQCDCGNIVYQTKVLLTNGKLKACDNCRNELVQKLKKENREKKKNELFKK